MARSCGGANSYNGSCGATDCRTCNPRTYRHSYSCGARWDSEGDDHEHGYICTLPSLHDGDHNAEGPDGTVVHAWGRHEGSPPPSIQNREFDDDLPF